jgi:hypothetical protein
MLSCVALNTQDYDDGPVGLKRVRLAIGEVSVLRITGFWILPIVPQFEIVLETL